MPGTYVKLTKSYLNLNKRMVSNGRNVKNKIPSLSLPLNTQHIEAFVNIQTNIYLS